MDNNINFILTFHQHVIIKRIRTKNVDEPYLFGNWKSSRSVDINKVYELRPRQLSCKRI